MATIDDIEKAGSYEWRFNYSGTSPFDIWHEGILLADATTEVTYIMYHDDDEEPPELEIRDADDTGLAQNEDHSPRFRFQWRGEADADYYDTQNYIAGEWSTVQTIKETEIGYYNHETTALADDTSHQFQAIPVDLRSYEGTPIPFTITMHCNPAAPSITGSYSSGTGNLTISAR